MPDFDNDSSGGSGSSQRQSQMQDAHSQLAKKSPRGANPAANAGKAIREAGQKMMTNSADRASEDAERLLGSMKRGGKVKRTGLYRLHKNERVVPARKGKGRGKKGRGGKGRS
jgi:hypothetical protein